MTYGSAQGATERWSWQIATKTITLSTADTTGGLTENLFTVTGEVEAQVFGFVDASVTATGALTLELGVTGNTAALIAITAKGELVLNKFWTATTQAVGVIATASAFLISAANILHVIRDSDATAGAITYSCIWRPVSADGLVVPT
jgi:hypothetical protein